MTAHLPPIPADRPARRRKAASAPPVEDPTGPHICRLHKRTLVLRDMRGATYEQKWCGIWYDCPEPGCHAGELIPSEDLKAYYRSCGSTVLDAGQPPLQPALL